MDIFNCQWLNGGVVNLDYVVNLNLVEQYNAYTVVDCPNDNTKSIARKDWKSIAVFLDEFKHRS